MNAEGTSRSRRCYMTRNRVGEPLQYGCSSGRAASWFTLTQRVAERRELVQRLSRLVASLPHDLRVVYVMCDLEELPGVEVARALAVPEGTLWRRLHEARRCLRAWLDGENRP
jgi:DNA-directed RNA polymerase specialized sigma24 family protein